MHNDLSDSLKLASSARERWYLLSLKSMQVPSVILMVNNCNPNLFYYVHGQYMASHLSKSITKESAKLKRLLAEYNSTVQPHQQLTWEQVCDLSSNVCSTSFVTGHSSPEANQNCYYQCRNEEAARSGGKQNY